jgi:hypothetical protein
MLRKNRPIPESVVEIDRDGAKVGSAPPRRRKQNAFRFGLLNGERSFIDGMHRDTCGNQGEAARDMP